jgi:Domain of unknown function (DUF3576)
MMKLRRHIKVTLVLVMALGLAACGGNRSGKGAASTNSAPPGGIENNTRDAAPTNYNRSSLAEALGPDKSDRTVNVNRFIWAATLDVLNFLPIQSVDPFTGIIVTGYGTPPGGGRSYRATVHIKDPALDARSLNLALQTKSGPVSNATARAVEDAILSRARQLRIADDAL